MSNKSSDLMAVPRIPRRVNRESIPLSFAQQRLWFLDQLEPNSPLYNVPTAVRLSGALSVEALQKSLDAIVVRHEALRTVFVAVDGNPVQVIGESRSVEFRVTDLSHQPVSERESELQCLLKEQVRRPFNISADLMLRASLVRLGDEEHLLLLVMHHIASDGWSRGVLFREITALYQAFSTGESSPLSELSIQYADYAVWQRHWLQGKILARQLSYWKKQLSGIPLLELPTDRPRPVIQTFRGARQSLVLPKSLVDRLKQLSRCEGVALFITMLAAWQTLLHRYTGQQDISIGSPIAGRNDVETEGLIGFFVNTLVLRTDLSADPTFRQLIARVRAVALEAYEHQDLPFEKLVEELHPDRNQRHSPLFQVMFAFQNLPVQVLALSGPTLSPVEIESETAKFDLTLLIEDPAGKLKAVLEYNTDLFNRDTIERMLGHYQTLLEGIVENPERIISELPLLSEAEKHQLLVEWNDTKREYPRDKCIHELFEEQAEKIPDAIAVVFEDEQLTYRELNGKANQLAHHLREQGVRPEVLVGICVERSLEMVVGLLGILKAGGAYVPLDPEYPKERLAFQLEDTKARVLLTQERLLGDLPEHDGRVICLDRDWAKIARESEANLESGVTAENLAYVIYTSGSTGQPKGATNMHRGICNRLLWMQEAYKLTEEDRVLQKTPFSFDVSVWEFFWPLITGSRLVMARPGGHQDSRYLVELITQQQITTLHFVPSMLRLFLEEPRIESCKTLRQVICSGEALSFDLQERFFERVSAKLYNLYGPTEASIDVTYWECQKRSTRAIVPIGRAIANTQLYILDGNLQPVPVGVTGELHISGDGLARGYLNRPELTEEKFIANPFNADPTSRLYKTGDLARYLPDGNIEFLGRIDHQVKIRGYRIELGEIEAVLNQDLWIQDAVVIARGDLSGDRHLVAYVVPKRQTGNSPEDPSSAEVQEQQVSEWQTLFDQTFAEADEPKDPTMNTAGVNSSYTNSPIPAAESRDWVEHAAQRILSLSPNRVLDIGCGLGRTLFRIAPYCSRYWGADFSHAALDYVEQHLDLLGNERAEIKLIKANADDLSEIPAGYFDTVIINGVTQYLPHIERLVKVLEGALNAVEPGGVIFVGDVRSLPLLEPFQLSVELFRASDDLPAELLWQTVKRNVAQEEELVVDPVFFSAICHRLTKIDRADVVIKRGWAQNELTRFRYDVILYVKPQEQPRLATAWLDWSKENLTLSSVRELLLSGEPRTLGIERVPNARVLPEYRAAASLARGGRSETARALRDAIETMRAEAFHPETFWALQDDLPYWVDITWSNTGGPECFDVFLQRRDLTVRRCPPASFQKDKVTLKPWHLYAHNPTEAKRNRLLGSFLRSHLKEKLPDYMIPSAFVVLDDLPLTPNGKIDRKALLAPDQSRPDLENAFVAARTAVEKVLAWIWGDILKLERVGIYDNFFELGGHSLLATQVVSRIHKALQVELPLHTLFETPTIAGWVMTMIQDSDQLARAERRAQLFLKVNQLSDDQVEKMLNPKRSASPQGIII